MSDAAKLDRHWHIMRMSSDDIPGKHLLEEPEEKNFGQEPSLSDAVALYLRLKGQNKPLAFEATLKRGCGYLIDSCGMKVLEAYSHSDATKFCDYLFAKGLNGASVARVFGTVGAVINLGISEFSLDFANSFSNIYFDRSVGVQKQLAVQTDDIKKVQADCYKANDEKRWLMSVVRHIRYRCWWSGSLSSLCVRRGVGGWFSVYHQP